MEGRQIGRTNEMDLATLAGGGVMEQFKEALEEIGRNIIDPNTDAEAKRSVTITVTFKPDRKREAIDVEGTVKFNGAGRMSVRTLAYPQLRAGGKVTLLEHTPPEQMDMVESLKPKVVGGKDVTK